MKRQDAERIATQYLKPVYGFALKRCHTIQDAEDLSQEIVIKVFHAVLSRDDIEDVSKFVWAVAHNTLANYYRDSKKMVGVSLDSLSEPLLNSEEDAFSDIEISEMTDKLHSEIAYLSKLQRRIVIAYYYENKKQNEIAAELNISPGTVKWHLFEAKKDLKRGMETMRVPSELKFNPIKFDICSTSGTIGEKGENSNFFKSVLSQNIVYAVWKKAKTVNEIADDLGVSPVYVESEADFLEEYGFLKKHSNKYLCNILLTEPTSELNRLQSEMYEKAAKLFANELFDTLNNSDIIESENIICAQKSDRNYIMWSLFPYVAAHCGKSLVNQKVSLDEVSTFRPAGGKNICYACVSAPNVEQPKYYESILKWNGPWRFFNENYMLWHTVSEWSENGRNVTNNSENSRDLDLIEHFLSDDILSKEEYAYLAQRGYIKIFGEPDGMFKAALQAVWIRDAKTDKELISVGDGIKEKHRDVLETLKVEYVNAIIDSTPEHLKKMQMYGLQNIFYCDAWFVLHCIKELLDNGKLKLPKDEQRKSISTLIISNK